MFISYYNFTLELIFQVYKNYNNGHPSLVYINCEVRYSIMCLIREYLLTI